MIMMQTGMVKQSVDYTASIKALDGTIIKFTTSKKNSAKFEKKIAKHFFWAAHIFDSIYDIYPFFDYAFLVT
jgi:hypothetical protein